ncbi:MAG TPA: sugar ABC transporter permease [Nitrososphaerales archaeon]|nr:sugar ABC transporter permease [Nitrososphaerales archaeon]
MSKQSAIGRIRGSGWLFILPALAGLIFLVLYPFAYNIYVSFTNMSVYHIRNFTWVGLKNYVFVLTSPDFLTVFRNSIVWTVANVVPTVLLGLLLAFVLNSKVKGKSIYRLFMIVPWAMPSFITLLIWQSMYNTQYGVINALLAEVGIPAINWLNDCNWAFIGIVIANIWLGYPFMMIIFSGALQSIPSELYEAASIDGAVGFRQLQYVSIPLIRPTILIAVLLGSIWTFNNFNSAYLITGGGPGICTTILITEAYKDAFGGTFAFAQAATYAFLAFIILFIPGIFWNRYTGLTRRST